jgi:serine/threonine-protein kinase
MKERDGCLCYKYFYGYPRYGPGIILPEDASLIRVMDYGSCDIEKHKEIYEADLILFICSSGIFKRQVAFEEGQRLLSACDNVAIICNKGQENDLRIYAQKFKRPILAFPLDSDPFRITKEKNRLFFQLLQYKRRNPLFYHLGKLLSRKKS